MASKKALYELGEMPELGHVPDQMHAQVIRPERFGEPNKAFGVEVVDTPKDLRPDEVLVYVMAAGVNYNNVWAGLGTPIDVTKNRPKDPWFPDPSGFHIGGSDASGIVWDVGSEVTDLSPGDRVVIHCGQWRREDPEVQSGKDPMYCPSFRIWGYETSWGSFAQFTRVQAHQCVPKPEQLSWEEAAAYMLVGATAYRMLVGWPPNTIKPGDPVLVWGGAGGLGSMAIQIVRELSGVPIAVISSEDKVEFCEKLGAAGCINRRDFDHWGIPPNWKDTAGQAEWAKSARSFGKAIWDIVGERRNPTIVFEHPGEDTIPTSVFVCDTGGMVVVCAGTTGYDAVSDLRYLWMRQKRLQGSHFANDEQAYAFNDLVVAGKIDPCLTETFQFSDIPQAHQLMYENRHPHGNMACLVNAPSKGMGQGESSL
jgi:crotonyl-CoA carboxylase/reductase